MSVNKQLIELRREALKKAGYRFKGEIDSSDVAISPWVRLLFFLPPRIG